MFLPPPISPSLSRAQGMPWTQGFKLCGVCQKPLPEGSPHMACLKCLGESYQIDRCKICRSFCPWTKKEKDRRLKLLLMAAALHPQSKTSPTDMALGSSASVHSAPASIREVLRKDSGQRPPAPTLSLAPKTTAQEQLRHRSQSPVPRKKHRKTDRGRFPSQAAERELPKGGRPVQDHNSSSAQQPAPSTPGPWEGR